MVQNNYKIHDKRKRDATDMSKSQKQQPRKHNCNLLLRPESIHLQTMTNANSKQLSSAVVEDGGASTSRSDGFPPTICKQPETEQPKSATKDKPPVPIPSFSSGSLVFDGSVGSFDFSLLTQPQPVANNDNNDNDNNDNDNNNNNHDNGVGDDESCSMAGIPSMVQIPSANNNFD